MAYSPSPRSYNFVKALEFTLPWEVGRDKHGKLREDGGLHYLDSDSATKWGIHQKANPDLDVANMTLDAAIEVYRDRYWLPYMFLKGVYIDLDAARPEYAVTIFDGGVNCGVPRMTRWFLKTHTEENPTKAINNLRREYYYELAKQERHRRNLKGWLRRLNDLEKYGEILRASSN